MKKLFAIVFIVVLAVSLLSVPAVASGSTNVSAVIEIVEGADNNRVALDGSFTANISLKNPSGEHISSYKVEITAEGYTMSLVDQNRQVGNLSVLNNLPNLSAYGVQDEDTLNTDGYLAKVKFTPTALGKKSITVTLTNLAVDYVRIPVSGISNSVDVTVYHTNHTWNTFGVEGATPDSQGYVTTKEATCQDGEAKRQCTVEGCELNTVDTKTLPGDPSKHVLGDDYVTDATSHWKVCSVCKQAVGKVDHDQNNVKDNGDGQTHSIKCSVCGYGNDKADHVLGDWQHDADNHYKVCSVCGAEVEKTAHTKKYTANDDSTTHKVECEVCQTVLVASEEHQGEWITDNDVACGQRAKQTRTCTLCNAVEVKENEVVEHKWDAGVVTQEATCTEPGEKVYKCTNPKCPGEDGTGTKPAEKKEVLEALGHDFTAGIEDKALYEEPTYLTEGTKYIKCARFDDCGEYEKQSVPKLSLEDHLTVTATVTGLVDNAGVKAAVEAKVKELIKAYAADQKETPAMSAKFTTAVEGALNGTADINVTVNVGMFSNDQLPAAFDKAPGTRLASKRLTITATVGTETIDEDIMPTLPAPADFTIEGKYPNLIGLLYFGSEEGAFGGVEFTKDGDVTTASAYKVGYYGLYTTNDLKYAEIFFDQTNVFNGSAVEPKVRIVVNGKELDSSYYTISYKNNTKVGTGEFSIELTAEGEAAGFTLEEPIVNDFEITAAPAKPTTKPAEKDKSQSDVPATGDETNVVLYAAVMVLCTAALALVLLRKKSSR